MELSKLQEARIKLLAMKYDSTEADVLDRLIYCQLFAVYPPSEDNITIAGLADGQLCNVFKIETSLSKDVRDVAKIVRYIEAHLEYLHSRCSVNEYHKIEVRGRFYLDIYPQSGAVYDVRYGERLVWRHRPLASEYEETYRNWYDNDRIKNLREKL